MDNVFTCYIVAINIKIMKWALNEYKQRKTTCLSVGFEITSLCQCTILIKQQISYEVIIKPASWSLLSPADVQLLQNPDQSSGIGDGIEPSPLDYRQVSNIRRT